MDTASWREVTQYLNKEANKILERTHRITYVKFTGYDPSVYNSLWFD